MRINFSLIHEIRLEGLVHINSRWLAFTKNIDNLGTVFKEKSATKITQEFEIKWIYVTEKCVHCSIPPKVLVKLNTNTTNAALHARELKVSMNATNMIPKHLTTHPPDITHWRKHPVKF